MIKLSKEKIIKIISLYKKGITIPEIARHCKVGTASVIIYSRHLSGYRKAGRKFGSIPWNKGKPNPAMIGNKNAFIGDRAKKGTGNARAWKLFREIQPCEKCGRELTSFFMVRHHKNENTLDNRKENIQWLCRSCHARHYRKSSWKNKYEQRNSHKIRRT